MKKITGSVISGLFIAVTVWNVNAAPIAVGPALNIAGDGLNSKWVDITTKPNNISDAVAALALDSSDFGVNHVVEQVVNNIDFWDDDYKRTWANNTGTNQPLFPDETFAVEFTGFINIKTEGTYYFSAYSDDGFQLMIGGETIMQYDDNRRAKKTFGSVDLAAGFYDFSFIGWDQGGAFVTELSWSTVGGTDKKNYTLIDDPLFFTTNPVPEPTTMLLFGTGIAGLAAIGRKRRK